MTLAETLCVRGKTITIVVYATSEIRFSRNRIAAALARLEARRRQGALTLLTATKDAGMSEAQVLADLLNR